MVYSAEHPIPVLYRDDHLLVVSKPSGLATTAPGGQRCLVQRVRAFDPDAPQLHPTSRLDAEASGIVTFARTAAANQWLLEARRRGDYVRRYRALGVGSPTPPIGRWDGTLAIDPQDPRRRMLIGAGDDVNPARRPRFASSRYAVRARAEALVLLDVWPETGRTHQIRVQASAAGCPLAGDIHYGGARRIICADGSVLRASRVMLHCAEVHFPGLRIEDALTVVDTPPMDMVTLWAEAGGDEDAMKGRT